MDVVHQDLLLLVLVILAARFGGEIATRVGAPAVMGELVAGVVLGPSLLGLVAPVELIRVLAEIGVVFLLFRAGLETDGHRLLAAGPKAIVVALGGFFGPLVLGYLLCRWAFALPPLGALICAGALTATSVAISVRLLGDLGLIETDAGQIVLGAAVLDDLIGVIALAVLVQMSGGAELSLPGAAKIILFVLVFALLAPIGAQWLMRLVAGLETRSETPGVIPTMVVALVLFFAWAAELFGVPHILGGFAAGLALSRRSYVSQLFPNPVNGPFARRVQQETRPLIQLFSPIFFVLVGLSLDLQAVAWGSGFIWVFSLSLGAVAVLGKFVGAVLLRAPWPQRVLIGMAMVPRAEVALIFAQMGQSAGLLDPPVYAGLIMVIAYTTLLSPFWVRRFRDLCRRTGRAHHLA
ncbi:MAG: cation:proton antiporter [Gammaproteobacteria bacterium]|nr:cation:proton antiporter [Gammaproteobacteria bacterium]